MDYVTLLLEWMQSHKTNVRICAALMISVGCLFILSLHATTFTIFATTACCVYMATGTWSDGFVFAWCSAGTWDILFQIYEHWPTWRDEIDAQTVPLTAGSVLLAYATKGLEIIKMM